MFGVRYSATLRSNQFNVKTGSTNIYNLEDAFVSALYTYTYTYFATFTLQY